MMDVNDSAAILASIIQSRITLLASQLDAAKQREDLPPYVRRELYNKLQAAKKAKKDLAIRKDQAILGG